MATFPLFDIIQSLALVFHSWRNELLKEIPQESALIRMARAGILLGTLILIPGVAVCWNLLPKSYEMAPPFAAEFEIEEQATEPESVESEKVLEPAPPPPASPSIIRALPLRPEPSIDMPAAAMDSPQFRECSIPSTSGEWPGREQCGVTTPTIPRQNSLPQGEETEKPVCRHSSLQRCFLRLESELQTLGATYYRLEKWGNSGELFRLSCYVAAVEPCTYQKHFQAIDHDEIRVMERVIAEIKTWRK